MLHERVADIANGRCRTGCWRVNDIHCTPKNATDVFNGRLEDELSATISAGEKVLLLTLLPVNLKEQQ
jgi:hypothetical protein